MNSSQELLAKIAKFQAKKRQARLAGYGLLVTLPLALSPFSQGANFTSFLSFLLIIPLPLYFLFESLKLSRLLRHARAKFAGLEANAAGLATKFSLGRFLTQPSPLFRLSLLLFLLVCVTALARLRTGDTTLSLSSPLLTNNR